MGALLLILLLVLIVFGLGFVLHALWWLGVVIVVLWLLGVAVRAATDGRRGGHWRH
ncbi:MULTISPECIES: hypothetical protein [unclassified Streptomyces]|uniref:hypothetical protein n=1 Tax=unclassified Streptomyces TaxID=2593676 RepID=UPI0004C5C0A6|nr:hypothetical protein [Streptomyces sp. NRRL F-5135]